jgi:hypothetical protein
MCDKRRVPEPTVDGIRGVIRGGGNAARAESALKELAVGVEGLCAPRGDFLKMGLLSKAVSISSSSSSFMPFSATKVDAVISVADRDGISMPCSKTTDFAPPKFTVIKSG